MLDKDCLWCPQKFETTKQLKNHITGATHNKQLEVVCPWCVDPIVTFRRVADLKDHAKVSHREKLRKLPNEILTEGNGYYIALHPESYRRFIKPASAYSRQAWEIKQAMRAWLDATKKTIRPRKDWEAGWKNGTRYDGPAGEEEFNPVYSGDEATKEFQVTDVDAWSITYFALIPWEITAEAELRGVKYRFSLSDTLLGDPKSLAAISRRMAVIPLGGSPAAGQKVRLLGRTFEERVALGVKLFGIPEKHFKAVFKLDNTFGIISKPLITATVSAPKCTVTSQAVHQKTPSPTLPPTKQIQYSPISDITTNSPAREMSPPPPPPKKPRMTPTYVPTPKDLLQTIQPLPTNPSPLRPLRTVSSRAKDLLVFGCMPLFPPARRDWTGEATVVLPGAVSTKQWPPQGWRNLTADQRKLQWEFIAFQYEQSMDRVRHLDRAGLLDTYNMFTLPGTAPHAKAKDSSKITLKSRYYLYELMRILALEEKVPDTSTYIMLDMLEKASAGRDKTTDEICSAMERAGIPLRLDA